MKVHLIHRCRLDEALVIHSAVTAFNEAGAELFHVEETFERSNTVYATYKALFIALKLCREHDVTDVDIVTNHTNVAREINGQPNPNARLLAMMHERLAETGITLGTVKYSAN